MSSALAAALVIGGPLIGALCALLGRYTRWWQVLFGAVVGTAVADVVFRISSKYVIQLAMTGNPSGVVVWATAVDWSGRLIWNVILLTIAIIVGGLVLLVRRLGIPNR